MKKIGRLWTAAQLTPKLPAAAKLNIGLNQSGYGWPSLDRPAEKWMV
jgi:hypothetical protein